MNIKSFTRFAGIMLAIGFFYSCAGSKGPTVNDLTDAGQYREAIAKLDEQLLESDGNTNPILLDKVEIFGLWAGSITSPGDRDSLYKELKITANKLSNNSPSNEQSSSLGDTIQDLWESEYNDGINTYENDSLGTRFSTAVAHFNNSITLDPSKLSSYRSKAVTQLDMGDEDEALATLLEGMELSDNVPASVYEDLAYLYLKNGDTDAAFENYDRSGVDIVSNQTVAYTFVNTLINQGKHEDAVALLESLVDLNPNDAQLKSVYGTELYVIASGIAAELAQAYSQNDSSLTSQLRFELEGNGELAETNLVEAYQLNPTKVEHIESLAVFYNNLSAEYLNLIEVAFNSDKGSLLSKAGALGKLAINYYQQLLDRRPNDSEIQSKIDTLNRLFN